MMDIRVVRIRITKLSVKITEHGFQREKQGYCKVIYVLERYSKKTVINPS